MVRMGKGERRSGSQQGSPFLKAPGLIFSGGCRTWAGAWGP